MSEPSTAANPAIGDFLQKLRSLPAAQHISDELVEFIYTLAYNCHVQGQYDKALEYLSFLMIYRPSDVRIVRGLGLTHQKLGNYGDALQLHSLAGIIDPTSPEHTLSAAECLLLGQQIEAAQDTLNLVINFCNESGRHDSIRQRAEALKGLIEKHAVAA